MGQLRHTGRAGRRLRRLQILRPAVPLRACCGARPPEKSGARPCGENRRAEKTAERSRAARESAGGAAKQQKKKAGAPRRKTPTARLLFLHGADIACRGADPQTLPQKNDPLRKKKKWDMMQVWDMMQGKEAQPFLPPPVGSGPGSGGAAKKQNMRQAVFSLMHTEQKGAARWAAAEGPRVKKR